MYIRRFALDLLGGFDPVFGAGYGEEVDFSQRAVAMGLRHVCADDVFTYHRGGGASASSVETKAIQDRNERILGSGIPGTRGGQPGVRTMPSRRSPRRWPVRSGPCRA